MRRPSVTRLARVALFALPALAALAAACSNPVAPRDPSPKLAPQDSLRLVAPTGPSHDSGNVIPWY
jgi:hypothetical protein